jgi:hypothetical protein
MQFYDELGVPRDASPETIKDTYRTVARLLHPDQQTEPVLKVTAERQMRRLNHIYATLSDPERRRRYDLDNLEHVRAPIIIHAPAPIPSRRPLSLNMMLWPILALVCIAAVLWVATHDESTAGRDWLASPASTDGAAGATVERPNENILKTTSDPTGSRGSNDVARVIATLRAQLREVTDERDIAQAQLARALGHPRANAVSAARVSIPTSIVAPPSLKTDLPRAEAPSIAQIPTPAPPVETPRHSVPEEPPAAALRFTGAWFYASTGATNRNPALYPPEFIETMISDRGGELHGRYRARYKITDRAISPDVNFQFEGESDGTSANLPWNGQGGSRGVVHLKLLGDNSMEVRWSANQLGTLGLSSGTAVLKRRPE